MLTTPERFAGLRGNVPVFFRSKSQWGGGTGDCVITHAFVSECGMGVHLGSTLHAGSQPLMHVRAVRFAMRSTRQYRRCTSKWSKRLHILQISGFTADHKPRKWITDALNPITGKKRRKGEGEDIV
jgi:hypothetical protein